MRGARQHAKKPAAACAARDALVAQVVRAQLAGIQHLAAAGNLSRGGAARELPRSAQRFRYKGRSRVRSDRPKQRVSAHLAHFHVLPLASSAMRGRTRARRRVGMRARHLAVRLLHVRPRIACPSRPRRNQLVHGRRRGRQGAHRATHARCSGACVGRSCCGARRRARGRVHTLTRTMARESQAVSSRLHVCAARMTAGACAAANDEIAHKLRRPRGRVRARVGRREARGLASSTGAHAQQLGSGRENGERGWKTQGNGLRL